MSSKCEKIPCHDGQELFVRLWEVSNAKGAVLVAHGHGEHSGRYEHVAARLNEEGWSVFAPDHRGHGETKGVRGHVMKWSDYVEDLESVRKAYAKDLPTVVIGHSMGGLIAVHYALAYEDKLRALILSSPLLKLAFPVPPLKAIVGKALSSLLPTLALPTGLDSKSVSRDPAVVERYENDSLVHDKASTRWFTEMLTALEVAHGGAASLKLPVLVFHAGDDRLTDIEGSKKFFQALTTDQKHFKAWAGLYHEIFNEPEHGEVLNELVAWLKPRLS